MYNIYIYTYIYIYTDIQQGHVKDVQFLKKPGRVLIENSVKSISKAQYSSIAKQETMEYTFLGDSQGTLQRSSVEIPGSIILDSTLW